MKTITTQPTLPLSIKSNQYGYSPAKTYFYIVDANNLIFHRDKKWRKKSLIEMNKYAYCTESSAQISMGCLTERFKKSLWQHEMELETPIIVYKKMVESWDSKETTSAQWQKILDKQTFINTNFPCHAQTQ